MIMQDLLVKIKNRPELYLGKKSLLRLISFIRGYEYCQNKYNCECSVLNGFDDYVNIYYGLSINNKYGFEKNILLHCGFDDAIAFDKFFQIYEKFNKKDEKLGEIYKTHNLHIVINEIYKYQKNIIKFKSLSCLMSFIYGYELCEELNDISYQKFEWNKLFDYIAQKYNINNKLTLSVESLINYISENDVDGFDKFYQEFNSYINSIYN